MPDTEDINNTSSVFEDELSPDELNGSWEQKGKSLIAAAITGLFIIGAVYFNVQSILITILTLVYQALYNIVLPDGLVETLDKLASELKAPLLISLVISQFLFMLFPSIWIIKKWHTKNVRKYLRIKVCSLKEIIIAVLVTVSALPLCYFISNLLMDSLNIPQKVRELGSEFFTATSQAEFIILIFVVAVTPAICEEIFFRGYVQRTLERTIGWKSILWTGVLFGLFHFQPLSLIILSILGLMFSFFYYRSKSILPSSFAHFTNNFIALFLLYSQTKEIDLGILSGNNIPVLLVILSTVLTFALLWLYTEITRKPKMI